MHAAKAAAARAGRIFFMGRSFRSILTPQYHFPKLRGKQSPGVTERCFGLFNELLFWRNWKLKGESCPDAVPGYG